MSIGCFFTLLLDTLRRFPECLRDLSKLSRALDPAGFISRTPYSLHTEPWWSTPAAGRGQRLAIGHGRDSCQSPQHAACRIQVVCWVLHAVMHGFLWQSYCSICLCSSIRVQNSNFFIPLGLRWSDAEVNDLLQWCPICNGYKPPETCKWTIWELFRHLNVDLGRLRRLRRVNVFIMFEG